jgi:hypothetical protein
VTGFSKMSRKSNSRRRKTRTRSAITRSLSTRNKILGYRKNYKRDYNKRVSRKKTNVLKRKTRSFLGALHSIRLREHRKRVSQPSKLSFKAMGKPLADRERICRSRRIRKEVLFALKKSGKSGQKKPIRRNPDTKCRR